MSCGVGWRHCCDGCDIGQLWFVIRPLAWELPSAAGAALKKQSRTKPNKTKPQKKKPRSPGWGRCPFLCFQCNFHNCTCPSILQLSVYILVLCTRFKQLKGWFSVIRWTKVYWDLHCAWCCFRHWKESVSELFSDENLQPSEMYFQHHIFITQNSVWNIVGAQQ